MEFISRMPDKDWNLDDFSRFRTELEQYLTMAIDASHAPLMIPRTTIDSAHTIVNMAGASAGAAFTALALEKTFSTTSAALVTAVSFIGRGVLKKALLIEKNSAGTAAFNAGMKITLDGNVVYNDAAAVARQSQFRVVVGNLITITSTSLYGITDDPLGLPFNSSCLIECNSDGASTITAGWNIAKKNA